jgi:hypothetical protein
MAELDFGFHPNGRPYVRRVAEGTKAEQARPKAGWSALEGAQVIVNTLEELDAAALDAAALEQEAPDANTTVEL